MHCHPSVHLYAVLRGAFKPATPGMALAGSVFSLSAWNRRNSALLLVALDLVEQELHRRVAPLGPRRAASPGVGTSGDLEAACSAPAHGVEELGVALGGFDLIQ
jgi:hypothetical protein